MEKLILPLPAVAGVLSEHYVESRLHGDGKIQEQVRAMQSELVGFLAYPTYLIVDPKTGRKLSMLVLENIESADALATRMADWLEATRRQV